MTLGGEAVHPQVHTMSNAKFDGDPDCVREFFGDDVAKFLSQSPSRYSLEIFCKYASLCRVIPLLKISNKYVSYKIQVTIIKLFFRLDVATGCTIFI